MLFDFSKVQKDFLAAAMRAEQKRQDTGWFVAYKPDTHETCLSNGNFAAIIPDDMCYVKPGNKTRVLENADFLKRNTFEEADQIELFDRGMRKKLDSPKKDICILECNDFCVWIDEKLLNYFSGMPCHYKGKSPKNPVMVYLGDSLIGLIMPIRQP